MGCSSNYSNLRLRPRLGCVKGGEASYIKFSREALLARDNSCRSKECDWITGGRGWAGFKKSDGRAEAAEHYFAIACPVLRFRLRFTDWISEAGPPLRRA